MTGWSEVSFVFSISVPLSPPLSEMQTVTENSMLASITSLMTTEMTEMAGTTGMAGMMTSIMTVMIRVLKRTAILSGCREK